MAGAPSSSGGPDLTPQNEPERPRRRRPRETFGDAAIGDNTLARYGRDITMHPMADWQEREDTADNSSDELDQETSPLHEHRTAGMPWWGRR